MNVSASSFSCVTFPKEEEGTDKLKRRVTVGLCIRGGFQLHC